MSHSATYKKETVEKKKTKPAAKKDNIDKSTLGDIEALADLKKKMDEKERYDEAAQMKTLIVMQILGNTKTFFETQSTIVDTDVNEYLNKTIEDQYGILFDMAQGQTMEDIINAQY